MTSNAFIKSKVGITKSEIEKDKMRDGSGMGSRTPGTGMYKQLMHVELVGIRLPSTDSVKLIFG